MTYIVGCGSGSDGAKCVPGLTVECPCPTGQNGSQTCTSAGTFAACACAWPTLDAAGIGGAGGAGVLPTGTGGQSGGTGGVIGPSTSLADASTTDSETAMRTITDSGVSAEVGPFDAPEPVAVCGDSVISGSETCDDGNTVAGDGCSATCHLEIGFKCSTPGSPCTRTTCGDSKKEGTEGCDDGNTMPSTVVPRIARLSPTALELQAAPLNVETESSWARRNVTTETR